MDVVPVADHQLVVRNEGRAAALGRCTALEGPAVGHHLPPVVDEALALQQAEGGHLQMVDDGPTTTASLEQIWDDAASLGERLRSFGGELLAVSGC